MKNLKSARAAIKSGNFKEAKIFYEGVLKELPDNPEAEWFYLFGLVTDEINKETADNYTKLSENFYPTLNYISTLEEGDEKYTLVYAMVKGFPPLRNILEDAIVKARALYRVDIPIEDVAKIEMAKRVYNEELSNMILKLFGEKEPYCLLVADIWKEMIAERFKWSPYRNFKDKGNELWFDELAKKIKKYDPSYQMPQFKQAGCISSGDAAKVTPGK